MLRKIERFVTQWDMLKTEDRVIVGVSGGADSVCLLFALLELQKKIPFEIVVVHVNHGLRGQDADQDEAYVKQLCKEYGLPFVSYFENVELLAKKRKQSTEEAGREVRRDAFIKTMEQFQGTKIALAHHKNDNVETFFLNLARGTGLKGLRGIRPVSGQFIRPLLCVTREEIEVYLNEKQIAYQTDKTNQSDAYTRNRIRNQIIPYLENQVNSRAVLHIHETIEQLAKIQEYMEKQVDAVFEDTVDILENRWVVRKDVFEKLPEVLQPILLKKVLGMASKKEKDIESVHLLDLQELFQKQVGKKIDLPYELEAVRVYEGVCLWIKQEKQKEIVDIALELSEKPCQIQVKNHNIAWKVMKNTHGNPGETQKNSTERFDCDIIQTGVRIRTRRPGDYITIHPDGKTQKLKSFFINQKIPQEMRDEILLVADGSHILWIVGYRLNCAYQVRKDTKVVLEISVNEGESYGGNN